VLLKDRAKLLEYEMGVALLKCPHSDRDDIELAAIPKPLKGAFRGGMGRAAA